MKKIYEAPMLEIELYELDASIAGNCDPNFIVSWGPGDDTHPVCNEFDDGGDIDVNMYGLRVSFYSDGTTCNCYTTSGGEGYFTS